MPTATLMAITGAGFVNPFNDYSTRKLSMALRPIAAAFNMSRTINADLVDLSLDQFHDKHEISISCTDQESPNFVGIRPGKGPLTVTCIQHLGSRPDAESAGLLVLTGCYIVGWEVAGEEYPADVSWLLRLTQ